MAKQIAYTIKVLTVVPQYTNGPVAIAPSAPSYMPVIAETLEYKNCAKPAVTPTEPPILIIDNLQGQRLAMIPMVQNLRVECEPQEVEEILRPTTAESVLLVGNDKVH